jgi:uracil phosphoribosyltransferase
MDSIVATGAAALMAVRVLLDHDVPEENISLGLQSTCSHKIGTHYFK